MKNIGYDSRRDIRSKPNVIKMDDIGEKIVKKKVLKREGSIILISTKEVVTIPPTMTIKGAIDTMNKYRFRRLPIVEPGRNRLIGIVTSKDIINFLGGGEKVKIIAIKHKGNFLSSINEPITEIMENAIYVPETSSISEGIEKMSKSKVDYLIVVNNEDEKIIRGIISERDFIELLYDKITGKRVKDFMTKNVITASINDTLKDVVLLMGKKFRRIPIVDDEDNLVGVVTTRTIINLIASNRVFSKLVDNKFEEVLNINVKEFMRKDIVTVNENDDLGKAAKLMIENKTGGLFIVKNGKIEGIITEHDLFNAIRRDLT